MMKHILRAFKYVLESRTKMPLVLFSCTADEDEITNFVAGQVEDFKRLRGGVIFTDKLPRNKTGKVVRRELAKLVA